MLDDDEGLIHVVYGASPFPSTITASVASSALVTTTQSGSSYPWYRLSELIGVGDWNGDGYGDLAAYVHNTYDPGGDDGVIQVFLGGGARGS